MIESEKDIDLLNKWMVMIDNTTKKRLIEAEEFYDKFWKKLNSVLLRELIELKTMINNLYFR